jgi:[acyl-carrier-protein] S-malonyltransferase
MSPGHSLGEYSALAAAGTFKLADAARLLKLRGQAMQRATPVGTGAMAALIGLDYEPPRWDRARCGAGEICQVANDNAPGQVVVSGHRSAVERADRHRQVERRPARHAAVGQRAVPLHLDAAGSRSDGRGAGNVEMQPPVVPLVANVTAGALKDPAAIRASLVRQVTATVRWRECIGFMAGEGVQLFAELGSGKVLSGLARRIAPDATAVAAGTPEEIAALARQISAARG